MAEYSRAEPLLTALAIGMGSALGGLGRVLAGYVCIGILGWPAPVATATVNVSGAFLIGLLHVVTLPEGRLPLGRRLRQGVLAGVLGGYTTFSILSGETLALLAAGDTMGAALNLFGSLALALAAVGCGHALGERLNGTQPPVLPTRFENDSLND